MVSDTTAGCLCPSGRPNITLSRRSSQWPEEAIPSLRFRCGGEGRSAGVPFFIARLSGAWPSAPESSAMFFAVFSGDFQLLPKCCWFLTRLKDTDCSWGAAPHRCEADEYHCSDYPSSPFGYGGRQNMQPAHPVPVLKRRHFRHLYRF